MVVPGSLDSVEVENFMTFTHAIFKPGQGFNVILGPNGSGKSSLVSAINIGLGGSLRILGRQQSLAEFINSNIVGAKEAKIRIKLYKTESETEFHTIDCSIRKEKSSPDAHATFKIDGKLESADAVRDLVGKLQIQTDNMCQFLPQDVVRKFPEMSPQDIFIHTIRALGDKETLLLHEEINSMKASISALKKSLIQKTDTHNRLFQDSQSHQQTRQTYQKYKNKLDLKLLHDDCLRYAQFFEVRERSAKEIGPALKKAKLALKASLAKKPSIQEKVNSYETRKADFMKELHRSATEYEAAKRFMISSSLDKIDGEIKIATSIVQTVERKKNSARKNIAQKEKELQKMELDLANLVPEDNLEQCKATAEGRRQKASEEVLEKTTRTQAANMESHYLRTRRRKLEECITKSQTEESMKLKHLEKISNDAYHGVMWLKQDSVNTGFKETVYPPIMTNIKMNSFQDAIYMEKLVGDRDLLAFVCEDSEDASRLMNSLRMDQGLRKINVVTADPNYPPNAFQTMTLRPQLRKFLVKFVSDTFEAPKIIKDFLLAKKNLHKVPIFSEDVPLSSIQSCRDINRYFVGRTYFETKNNRYSAGSSTRSENLGNNRVTYFPNVDEADDDELVRLQNEYANLSTKVLNQEAEAKALQQDLDLARRKEEQFNKEIQQFDATQREREKLLQDINSTRNLIEEIAMTMNSSNGTGHVEGALQKRRDACLKLASASSEMQEKVKGGVRAHIEKRVIQVKLAQLEGLNAETKLRHGELEREIREGEMLVQKTKDSLEVQKQLVVDLYKKLEFVGVKEPRLDIPDEKKRAFERSCPTDVDDIKAKIILLEKELKTMPQISENDRNAAFDAQKKLELAEKDKDEISASVQKLIQQLKEREDNLCLRIDGLVNHQICGKFSAMMSKLGNAGSVVLERSSDPANFKGYGISIMVRFTSNHRSKTSEMQRLSATMHSGGEKSVTTALYMMALQELTQVPFRCVDEINQGMDETNERLVWDLLLHTATNFSAQYLYLAPKFPRQLEYNDDMTVTFVNNGMNKIAKRGRDKGRQKGKLVHTDGIERYLNAIKKRKKGKAK